MSKLKKFAITTTICGVVLLASSGYVLADNWLNARSIGNKSKALPPEIVISDDDETDVLEVTNSFSGEFVLGEGDVIELGYIEVKNQTDDRNISFKFQSFLEDTNKPIYVNDLLTSKLFDKLYIDIKNKSNGNIVYKGYLGDLDYYGNDDNKTIIINAGEEVTFEFIGRIKDLDIELAGEEITYGVGIMKQ